MYTFVRYVLLQLKDSLKIGQIVNHMKRPLMFLLYQQTRVF
jgi:hypothetical protein